MIEHYEWAQRVLQITLGNTPSGKPLYRFCWGSERLQQVGGKWEDRDANGSLIREVIELRQVPKYSHLGVQHFFVERWYPPEHFGTRSEWEAKTLEREDGISIPALGPYPSEGEYEWAWTVEGPNGEFRQLTLARVEWIASVLKDAEARNAVQRRILQDTAKAIAKKMQREIDLELLREATPAFHGMLRRGTTVIRP